MQNPRGPLHVVSNGSPPHVFIMAQFLNFAICDVGICDDKCRNSWLVSRFVTEIVAVCDNVKMCIFTTYMDSICIDMLLFIRFTLTNRMLVYRSSPYLATATVRYMYDLLCKNYLGIKTMRKWLKTHFTNRDKITNCNS